MAVRSVHGLISPSSSPVEPAIPIPLGTNQRYLARHVPIANAVPGTDQ